MAVKDDQNRTGRHLVPEKVHHLVEVGIGQGRKRRVNKCERGLEGLLDLGLVLGLLVPLDWIHLKARLGRRLFTGHELDHGVVAESNVQVRLGDRAHARSWAPIELVLRHGLFQVENLLLSVAVDTEQVALERPLSCCSRCNWRRMRSRTDQPKHEANGRYGTDDILH